MNGLTQGNISMAFSCASNLANVILVFIAYRGLQQIRIAKEDIRLRSQREAATLAVSQCEKFAQEIVPAHEKLLRLFPQVGFKPYPGPIKDFMAAELKDTSCLGQLLAPANASVGAALMEMLNKLEAMAIYFEKGIADEVIAYPSIADAFCKLARIYYPVIALFRPNQEGQTLYPNLVNLYKRWAARQEQELLVRQKERLEQQLNTFSMQSAIRPIGTDVQ